MSQKIIDLEISSPGAAPSAANMKPTESIGFSNGRQSLDRSVWYSGSLLTFLANGEESSSGCSFCSLPPGSKDGSRNSVCRHRA